MSLRPGGGRYLRGGRRAEQSSVKPNEEPCRRRVSVGRWDRKRNAQGCAHSLKSVVISPGAGSVPAQIHWGCVCVVGPPGHTRDSAQHPQLQHRVWLAFKPSETLSWPQKCVPVGVGSTEFGRNTNQREKKRKEKPNPNPTKKKPKPKTKQSPICLESQR